MITGYSNLALPPLRVWEKEEEEEGDMLKPMVGFSWYLNQEESMKKEGEEGMRRQSITHTLCGYYLIAAFIHPFALLVAQFGPLNYLDT
ncbi:hypothetical protein PILCRDRAFT_16792 [Piloderma croceum F 1598]|uniref:Uncharacterized protein n=1 Tax=Piloderma croceum (strain F 1598) TaxID=765440 RepID=A0A0C3EGF3_PILCF|nr:hypothetical protein PILCRDRAFT_16792 [Piloderma croceum F 1598]